MALFERVAAVKPDRRRGAFDRGFLLQEFGDHDAAMAAFRRALEVNPDHDRAHYGLALSLIAQRRLQEAVAPLKRNTRLQPMSPYGWYQLARVQHDLGHVAETQKISTPPPTFEPSAPARARDRAQDRGLS